jgi:uncharacterized protein YjbI with pentapeptide repeats
VFIVGLSRDLLDKMTKIKLEKAGLKDEEAEGYVRKIIQIEINIQDWNNESIGKLIKSLTERLDKIHRKGVEESQDLILKAVARNPRQTKRFINNFIVASSAKPELNERSRVYFCREVIVNNWPEFYNNLRSDENFRNLIVDYLKKPVEDRKKALEEERQKDKKALSISEQRLLEIVDENLWNFLDEEEKKTKSFSKIIEDWQKYESIGESLKGSEPLSQELNKEELINLLKRGKVDEFNDIRGRSSIKILVLSGGNLYGANLSGANLSDVRLNRANLSDANLSDANLSNAILSGTMLNYANLPYADLTYALADYANLYHAKLSYAKLYHADLSSANLSDANLSNANLSGAKLSGAKLSGADLSGANLSNAILSGANLSNVKTDNRTNFEYVELTSAYPSSIVTDITARSITKESNAKSSSADTEPSVHHDE